MGPLERAGYAQGYSDASSAAEWLLLAVAIAAVCWLASGDYDL